MSNPKYIVLMRNKKEISLLGTKKKKKKILKPWLNALIMMLGVIS